MRSASFKPAGHPEQEAEEHGAREDPGLHQHDYLGIDAIPRHLEHRRRHRRDEPKDRGCEKHEAAEQHGQLRADVSSPAIERPAAFHACRRLVTNLGAAVRAGNEGHGATATAVPGSASTHVRMEVQDAR